MKYWLAQSSYRDGNMRIGKHIRHALMWLAIVLSVSFADTQSARPAEADKTRSDQVARLISQLGADTYEKRKLAQARLRQMGQAAIDQLIAAQYSNSPEISFAVQQVLGEMSIVWTRDDDPQIAADVMRDYDQLSEVDRLERATWLAQLEDGKALTTLARLVRYERSETLSKRAAISLMQNLDVQSADSMSALDRLVDSTLAGCDRTAVRWIKLYRQLLQSKGSDELQQLNQFANDELGFVANVQTTTPIQAKLLRIVVEAAAEQDNTELLETTLLKLVEVSKNDQFELVSISNWLLDQQQHSLFRKLIWDRFEDLRKKFPLLVYCGAESWLATDPGKAEKLAEKAFNLTDSDDPVRYSQDFFLRRSTCFGLEERGLTEWAIREFRRLVDTDSKNNWRIEYYRKQGAKLLADLLHDRGRDEEAADTLEALLDPGEEDEALEDDDPLESASSETRAILARMYFFRAEQSRQESDRENQMQFLEKAAKADPTDADVLIGMHRVPRADAEWKEKTNKLIRTAIETFENANRQLRRAGDIENRQAIATNLNQMAWLVSNTPSVHNSEVLHKAVKQSARSLELRPHAAGYLDTLGRTWFAVGNLENALRYQRRAVKLEPHTKQILKQLAEFEGSSTGIK